MTSHREGDLVTVAGARSSRDGIVFHVPSSSKVIVAVPDRERGAVLRTVHPRTLSEVSERRFRGRPARRLAAQEPTAVGLAASADAHR